MKKTSTAIICKCYCHNNSWRDSGWLRWEQNGKPEANCKHCKKLTRTSTWEKKGLRKEIKYQIFELMLLFGENHDMKTEQEYVDRIVKILEKYREKSVREGYILAVKDIQAIGIKKVLSSLPSETLAKDGLNPEKE